MKKLFLGFAALALLLIVTEDANAQYRRGGAYYGGGGYYPSSGIGVSYGTRVGNSGFLSVGYSSYPTYSYVAPAYYTTPVYATPVYYAEPVYYSQPAYYRSGPVIGASYYRGGRWGRWGW